MQKILITVGLLLLISGLLWPWLKQLNLFHLPGDIVIKNENSTVYIPITSMILLSLLFSLILYIIRKISS